MKVQQIRAIQRLHQAAAFHAVSWTLHCAFFCSSVAAFYADVFMNLVKGVEGTVPLLSSSG